MFPFSNKNVLHVSLFSLQKILMYVTSLNSTLESEFGRYHDKTTFYNNKVLLFCIQLRF